MKIDEIDYSPGVDEPLLSDAELINGAELVGDIDNRDVWLYARGNQELYFIHDGNNILAAVLLKDDHIRMVKKNGTLPGAVTAIVGFLTHRLKKKLKISKNEPLTPAGFRWLTSLIRAGGRGLTITDQFGKPPDLRALQKEWNTAMSGDAGPTEIVIESHMRRHLPEKKEKRLMPTTWAIGDKRIQ